MPDDPFSILGLPPAFEVSSATVEHAYLSRAAAAHPDVVGDGSGEGDFSARLNEAKQVLLNPESRATALLALLHGPPKEQDKSLPDGFLMEFMEVRDAVDTAVSAGNAAEVAKWHAWAMGQRRGYEESVGLLFRTALERPDPPSLVAIRRALNAWRYIERMIDQMDPTNGPRKGAP